MRLCNLFLAIALCGIAAAFPENRVLPDSSEDLQEFQLVNANLNDDASLVLKVFSLGKHQDGEVLLNENSGSQNYVNGTYYNVNWNVEYPSCGRKDLKITFVDVFITSTSTEAKVERLEGGFLEEKIKFRIQSNQTYMPACTYRIYGLKERSNEVPAFQIHDKFVKVTSQ